MGYWIEFVYETDVYWFKYNDATNTSIIKDDGGGIVVEIGGLINHAEATIALTGFFAGRKVGELIGRIDAQREIRKVVNNDTN